MSTTTEEVHAKINGMFDELQAQKLNAPENLTDKIAKATGEEPIGSVKNVDGIVYKKISVGGGPDILKWMRADLTDDKKGDILSTMSEQTTPKEKKAGASLIPSASTYLDNGFNVLLIGLHGTGKTQSIQDLARERNLKMKYFSCSTLDPYTDLVGVPTPRDYCPECQTWHKDVPVCPDCNGRTVESLKMIRPREVDEAELIFFDEFNRADSKTTNAIFEIIQFGAINGEPLPNLKACWAAMNPPDDDQNYQVELTDPALLDRFDVYVEITPKPSVIYMSKHMPVPIAVALKRWWDDHQNAIRQGSKDAHTDYISPRRLEKIGLVWCATKNARSVFASLPTTGNFEKQKLVDFLKQAQKEIDSGNMPIDQLPDDYNEDEAEPDLSGSNLGDRPASQFTYKPSSMRVKSVELAEYLTQNPMHYETHKAVVNGLQQGVGGEELCLNYSSILNALNPSSLEGLIAKFPAAKISQMRNGFVKLHKDNPTHAASMKNLYKVLNAGNPTIADWPKL